MKMAWQGRCTAALLLLFSMAGSAMAQPVWSDEYDALFSKYSKRYFGAHFDWHWFKAQAIAESGLTPSARSPVGAQGIMQIMPTTYNEIKDSNPHFGDISAPRWNIAAGIYYNRILFRKWQDTLSEQERLLLTFASYNAGLGSIRKAFKRTPPPVSQWDDVAPKTPRETQGYVKRIRKLRKAELLRRLPSERGIAGKLKEENNPRES